MTPNDFSISLSSQVSLKTFGNFPFVGPFAFVPWQPLQCSDSKSLAPFAASPLATS